MDSYTSSSYRDAPVRSPVDRNWASDDSRGRDRGQRDPFFRGRSPGHERRERRRSRSPLQSIDRYEPRGSRMRDDYALPRDRDRDDRARRINDPPANIDRYVPGLDGGVPGGGGGGGPGGGVGGLGGGGGGGPGGGGPAPAPPGPPGPLINPLEDPSRLGYQVGFSYFGEWWKMNKAIEAERDRMRTGRRREPDRPRGVRESPEERDREKAKIQAAYDAYKEDLQARMAREFTDDHKKEQWFRERYVPEVRTVVRRQLADFRRGLYAQWEQDLDGGLFDDLSLEGVPKSELTSSGGMVEREEGEATATSEVMGVGDLVPAPAADIRDESLFQPTLLIKTIAPHVSRANVESFCREHLGEGPGGFRWLSLSDPNPSKRYHRIGWVLLHPAPDPTLDPATGFDRIEPKDEDEDENGMTSKLRTAGRAPTADRALEAVNGKTVKDELRGDFVCHVGVHTPPMNPRRKALWDLFSASDRIDRDLALASRLVDRFEAEYGGDLHANVKIRERVDDLRSSGRLRAAAATGAAQSSYSDSRFGKTQRKKLQREDERHVADFDVEEGEHGSSDEEHEDGAVDEDEDKDEDEDDEDLVGKKKLLDFTIEYLRRVFCFCFFCVFESDSVHELTRKCPGGHLRRPRSTLTAAAKEVARASALGEPFPIAAGRRRSEPNEEGEIDSSEAGPGEGRRGGRHPTSKSEQQLLRAFNWVRTFEDKISQILEPDRVDVRRLGGRPVDDAVAEELAKYSKQEDEHKWRCKVPECTKLFKEEHFWRKHVEKRHADWLDAMKQDFELINAYVLDPAHIAPSRTDANSNGHFPQSNGQGTAGTPRGFTLQNFSMNPLLPNLPNFPGAAGPPPFPHLFPPGAPLMGGGVGSPGGWNGGPGIPGGIGPMGHDDHRGPGGPIRRGGGMFGPGRGGGGYRSGPYDRRTPNPRWDGNPGGGFRGRLGGGHSGPGRWGDGAAGGAAMGPREAVQGRSLKSYEDLDQAATGGAGGGELNY